MSERPVIAWRDITGDIVAHKRKGVEPSRLSECGLTMPDVGGVLGSDYLLQARTIEDARHWVISGLGQNIPFRHCYACWDAMPA